MTIRWELSTFVLYSEFPADWCNFIWLSSWNSRDVQRYVFFNWIIRICNRKGKFCLLEEAWRFSPSHSIMLEVIVGVWGTLTQWWGKTWTNCGPQIDHKVLKKSVHKTTKFVELKIKVILINRIMWLYCTAFLCP